MKIRKRWVIPAAGAAVLAAIMTAACWYTRTPEFRARQLIAEVRERNQPPGRVRRWLRKLGLSRPGKPRDWADVRKELVALGPGAVGPLVRTLKNDPLWEARRAAAEALVEIGPAGIPRLIQVLETEGTGGGRPCVGEVLAKIGRPAVPALIQALKDEQDHRVQWRLSEVLARIGPPAVPALAEALNERDKAVRCCAAWALGAIGPRAEEAAPALCRALEDENADVRRLAALALVRIDPAGTAEKVVPVLIRHLKNPDLSPQFWPIRALGDIGPPAEQAVPALIQTLQDNKTMRVVTARALGRICPRTRQATIHINAKSSDEEVRRAVDEVMAQIRARHAAESPQP